MVSGKEVYINNHALNAISSLSNNNEFMENHNSDQLKEISNDSLSSIVVDDYGALVYVSLTQSISGYSGRW